MISSLASNGELAVPHFTPSRFGFSVLRGVIDRRILVNFRCKPDVLTRLLPAPFRPKLVRGWGMAGICLIRVRDIRPAAFPAWLGLTSENAAHRIAVEWSQNDVTKEGVFIQRRDTGSWLNQIVGGKLFPGVQHAADFFVKETSDRFAIRMHSRDSSTSLQLMAHLIESLPTGSIFESLTEASEFFAKGSCGWSVTKRAGELDGLELRSFGWRVEPLAVDEVESSFFADGRVFPIGSIEFDCALLMRGIPHEWHNGGKFSLVRNQP